MCVALFGGNCQEWAMFFVASKILSVVLEPLLHPYLLLLAAAIMRLIKRRRAMRLFVGGAILLPLVYGFLPLSQWPLRHLENAYQVPQLEDQKIDGIIVLGGHTGSGWVSQTRNQAQLNGSAERFTTGLSLHLAHPDGSLIFSGFSGSLNPRGWNEAEINRRLVAEMRADTANILYERTSRNTFENAVYSLEVAVPQSGDVWVLVTSAAHMPRAKGAFAAAGWDDIIAYPVDFQTAPYNGGTFNIASGMNRVRNWLHEYVGLAVYWATGRSTILIP